MELQNNIHNYECTLKKVLSSYKVRQISLWALDMCGVLISILAAMVFTLNYQNIDINTIILALIYIYDNTHNII